MSKTQIAVIGSGSVFTPELVLKLAQHADALGGVSLRFYDIDRERQATMTAFCNRLLGSTGQAVVQITETDSADMCVDGADFILLQLRQGGINARIQDEKLGRKYQLPFTETISICGFSTFLRTYYEYERLARVIKARAPEAWVMNFTNPAGQLSETLYRLGIDKVVGICNGFMGMQAQINETLGITSAEYIMNWRGLNHLTIVDGIYHNGRNRFGEFLELSHLAGNDIRVCLGAALSGYYSYYFDRVKIVEKQQLQPTVRSEDVKAIDEALLCQYQTAGEIPNDLAKRGGYGYSTAVVNVLKAICLDEGSVHYAVVKNGTALPRLPRDAFVEVPVMVKRSGPYPLVLDELPPFADVMTYAVKTYERALITAAAQRDKRKLLQSMMIHPLMNCYSVALPLLDDCLEINKEFIPNYS